MEQWNILWLQWMSLNLWCLWQFHLYLKTLEDKYIIFFIKRVLLLYVVCYPNVLSENTRLTFSFQKLWIASKGRILLSVWVWMLRVARFVTSSISILICIFVKFLIHKFVSRQLFQGWVSCIWIYMLNVLRESTRYGNIYFRGILWPLDYLGEKGYIYGWVFDNFPWSLLLESLLLLEWSRISLLQTFSHTSNLVCL